MPYLCMVMFHNYTYSNYHFEIYRSVGLLFCVTGTNIVLHVNNTSKTNLQKKISVLSLPDVGDWEMKNWMKAVKHVQTSSYKMNTYWGFNVQHNKYNTGMCYIWKVRVIPKSSHHKENCFFYFFNILCTWDHGCSSGYFDNYSMDLCKSNHYIVHFKLSAEYWLESESRSVKSDSETPWLYSPWNSPGKIQEWVAFPSSPESSQPRDQTQVSGVAGEFFTSSATREPREYQNG